MEKLQRFEEGQMDASFIKESSEWSHYHLLSRLPQLLKISEVPWDHAFSEDQLLSKFWILETLRSIGVKDLGQVMILGGWVGLLGYILLGNKHISITKVRSFDIDHRLEKIADSLNMQYVANAWKFKAAYGNWSSLNYQETVYQTHRWSDGSLVNCVDSFQTVINTCCEHSENLETWIKKIPEDRLLILQSNSSSEYEGHVNPSPTLEDFQQKAKLGRTLFAGCLPTPRYNRWMLIGYRG